MAKENPIEERTDNRIYLSGFLVFLTIISVSVLHSNEYEFIVLRFPCLTIFQVALFDTMLYLSYLIIGITVGILSDRLGKRKFFILFGNGVSALFFWLMTINFNYPNPLDYNLLLLFRFFQGAATVSCWQTLMTLILDLSTSGNRGKNMGIFGIFLVSAMGAGPVLGGLFAAIDVFVPYYAAMIFSIIVFIISLLALKDPEQIKQTPSFKKVLGTVKRHPRLAIPGIFNIIDRLHMGFIIFILPIYLQMVLNLRPELRGMVLGLYALPSIFLQYPIGKISDKVGRYKFLIVGSIGYGIVLSLIGIFGQIGFIVLLLFFVLLGVFAGITQPPTMALVGDIVNPKENSMGMGFFNFVGNVGIIIGPVIAGYITDNSNFIFAFLIAGLIELISLGIVILIKLLMKDDNE